MRSAIRGDFERLAERRGGQELMREAGEKAADDEPPPADSRPEPSAEPAPEDVAGTQEHAREPEGEHPAGVAPSEERQPHVSEWDVSEQPPVEDGPDAHEPLIEEPSPETEVEQPRRSWLDRLLGR